MLSACDAAVKKLRFMIPLLKNLVDINFSPFAMTFLHVFLEASHLLVPERLEYNFCNWLFAFLGEHSPFKKGSTRKAEDMPQREKITSLKS